MLAAKESVGSISELGMQVIMDYTTVPIGWWVVGKLWTGQPTRSTATCPSCGRVGVISAFEHGKRVMVHTGRVAGNTLTGIDYCELGNEENHHHLSRIDPNSRLYLTPESRAQGQRVIYSAAIAADEARQDNQRKNYARDVDESTVGN